ncbi:uncharacterized protein [Montipora capricornis]|uniref:uncharacterized protein n=1 Tax=Montipora capricornis TaxID=246305 RepID=UPI0035F1B3D9
MNATTLYVEACKCMLYLDAGGQAVWDQLFHLLPRLRQALTCRVCRRLLVDPYGSHNCEHHVCKGCLRKKRSLNPACRWCTNLEKLTEDKQTKIVLACYQKLCEFIAREVPNAQGKPIMPQNGEYNKVFSIIQEAVTSPISLANGLNQQSEEVPDKVPEGESNSQISSAGGNLNREAESRVAEPKLSPEVERFPPQTLTKDISPSSTGSESSCNKKRKRKPFKGTYYNYNKKKKTSPRQSVSGPDLSCSSEKTVELNSLDSETSCGPSEESEGKEVGGKEIVDIDHLDHREAGSQPEVQKQRTVVMPPGKKRTKGKSKRCSCGTTTKLQSPRCVTTRCPCFSDGGSCESCPCLNCGNPFNNNNNKLSSEDGYQLRFVDEKSLVTFE